MTALKNLGHLLTQKARKRDEAVSELLTYMEKQMRANQDAVTALLLDTGDAPVLLPDTGDDTGASFSRIQGRLKSQMDYSSYMVQILGNLLRQLGADGAVHSVDDLQKCEAMLYSLCDLTRDCNGCVAEIGTLLWSCESFCDRMTAEQTSKLMDRCMTEGHLLEQLCVRAANQVQEMKATFARSCQASFSFEDKLSFVSEPVFEVVSSCAAKQSSDLDEFLGPDAVNEPKHPNPVSGEPTSRLFADEEKKPVEIQKVEFSCLAPKTLARGEYSIIQVVMYEPSYRHIVEELRAEMDEPSQEKRSGMHQIAVDSEIRVVLSSPDFAIEDNTETGIWRGEHLEFAFAVMLPEEFRKRQTLFMAMVYVNDIIATKLKFVVKCAALSEQEAKVEREDILSAFVSYASQDRGRVAAIIQGMQKARPDIDVFFDVDSLRSGEDWEEALHREIEKRDVLFLCWSQFARKSKWVEAEWRYALERKGLDCIEPVPIEPPDVCPPPEELSKKHFNDKLLFVINAHGNNERKFRY